MDPINKLLIQHVKPYKSQLFSIVLLITCIVVLQALAPWPFKYLIDNVLEDAPLDKTSIIGTLFSSFHTKESVGFIVVFLFFGIHISLITLEYFRSIQTKKILRNVISNFSQSAFGNLELLSIGFYRNQQIGDYIYRLSNDISAIGDLLENGIIPLVTSVLYLLITTIILLFINVKLTLLSLFALPFLSIGLYIINRKVIVESKKSELSNSAIFSFIQQVLTQLKIIQAYSQEKKELEEFSDKISSSLKTEYNVSRLNFLLSLIIGVIIAISYSFIIGYGIQNVFSGELTAGLLIVFIFYLDNITNPILSIIYATTVIKESQIKISRIQEFFNKQGHIKDSGKLTKLENSTIKFENVTLYGEENKKVLDDISFTIPQGKITVIVGVSGSGKTSLISLIPRLINEPSKGTILLGKHNINDYSVKTLRNNIAYVPQEILLFNTTIREIISFGKEDATMEEIKHAANLASASEFIDKRDTGYNFKVGEEGNYLSGGQRQRLMLARAYIKNCGIMILDEVFSSQDVKTRLEMLSNLKKFSKEKTTIIVSNDLEVISEADYVIVINNGKIINIGTHADFLKKDLLRQTNYYKLLIGQ